MSKINLINNFQIIIHRITADNEKAAPFKIRQYADAIKIIKQYPKENIEDIADLTDWFKTNGKNNPKKIIEKINIFLSHGYIPEAKEALQNPVVKAITELTKIASIGPAKAKELQSKYNITTIDDLRSKYATDESILHNKQKIGLRYHNDLIKRIPRSELNEYNTLFMEMCSIISPDMVLSINGSYRRKHDTSGDIDVLISGPDNSTFRNKFIKMLKDNGIIKEVLASGSKKFMGICKLNNYETCRHIDIIDTTPEQYPFAQLYFTGSGGFNAQMRLVALQKGFTMNEYCMSHKSTKIKVDSNTIFNKLGKPNFETEQDIFTFLDMDYIEPEHRNVMTLSKINK